MFNKNDGNAEETSKMSNFEYCHTDPVAQFLLKICNLFAYIEYISVCACTLTYIHTYKYLYVLNCLMALEKCHDPLSCRHSLPLL